MVEPKACPKGIECVPAIRCPAHLNMLDSERPVVCSLNGIPRGLCCKTGQNHTTDGYLGRMRGTKVVHRVARDTRWSQPIVDESIRDEADFIFSRLNNGPSHVQGHDPASFHHQFIPPPSQHELEWQRQGVHHAIASKVFKER